LFCGRLHPSMMPATPVTRQIHHVTKNVLKPEFEFPYADPTDKARIASMILGWRTRTLLTIPCACDGVRSVAQTPQPA